MKRFLTIYTGSAEAMQRWQTLDEATRLARRPEGFFPGDSVEIMECLPIPAR